MYIESWFVKIILFCDYIKYIREKMFEKINTNGLVVNWHGR